MGICQNSLNNSPKNTSITTLLESSSRHGRIYIWSQLHLLYNSSPAAKGIRYRLSRVRNDLLVIHNIAGCRGSQRPLTILTRVRHLLNDCKCWPVHSVYTPLYEKAQQKTKNAPMETTHSWTPMVQTKSVKIVYSHLINGHN